MPGSIIKRKRQEANLSQQELADRLFISQSALSKIENREVALSVSLAIRIARELNCSFQDLLPSEVLIDNAHVLHSNSSDGESHGLHDTIKKEFEDLRAWLDKRLPPQTL